MDIIDFLLAQKKNDAEQYYTIANQYQEFAKNARDEYKLLYQIKQLKKDYPEEYKLFIEKIIKSYDELGECFLDMDKSYAERFMEKLKENKKKEAEK